MQTYYTTSSHSFWQLLKDKSRIWCWKYWISQYLLGWKKQWAFQFNFKYQYIDDVLSIKNTDSHNYLGQKYTAELEIKDTTESNTSASYLDLLLSIGKHGKLRTSLYDKYADFNFHITKIFSSD